MVGGFLKAYNFPLDYVLYDLSYSNMILFGAVLPSYQSKEDKEKMKQAQDVIKASDVKNNDKVKDLISKMV